MSIAGRLGALVLAAALSGCATTGGIPADPIEPFNRAMFSFNDALDSAVLKPVAKGYRAVAPSFVRTGISNFFSNIEDVWVCVNNLLQGKIRDGAGDFLRVAINSTVGILGFIDVASSAGIDKHNEDFGQTLGRWGIGPGPYLVLPFFGSSTLRDGLGLVLDFKADPILHIHRVPTRNTLYAGRTENTRANALDVTDVLEEAALDKYTYVRSAWLQRRRNLVYDGNPPREREEPNESDPAPARGKSSAAPSPDPVVSAYGATVMTGTGEDAAPLTTTIH